jgi:hypothetical protein
MMNGNIYKPMCERPAAESKWSKAKVADRKSKFAALNAWVRVRGGWIVSVPGDREVRIETLENSGIPEELRKLGYTLSNLGQGERILHHAIEQKFTRAPDGTFVPLTPGSSGPVALVTQHAGIVTVARYGFDLP